MLEAIGEAVVVVTAAALVWAVLLTIVLMYYSFCHCFYNFTNFIGAV